MLNCFKCRCDKYWSDQDIVYCIGLILVQKFNEAKVKSQFEINKCVSKTNIQQTRGVQLKLVQHPRPLFKRGKHRRR